MSVLEKPAATVPSAFSKAKPPRGKSLETVAIAGFVSMLLLLGGIGGLSIWDTLKIKRAILWVDRTREVMEMLKELELDVREAESALRTYLLTGDPTQRDEYRRQAFDEMQSHLRELRRLSFDNPDQQAKLDEIEPVLGRRVAVLEGLRKAHDTVPGDAARERDLSVSGANLTDQLVKRFDEFIERENRLLAMRIAARESDAHLAIAAIIASGALGFGCVATALFVILRGLRRRHEAEQQLQVSLGEKEILLKEVHHRVKNNLQVISSLLSLQGEKLKDPEAITVFQECRDRVHSMARLHQQLYAKGHFAYVEFGDHLQEMAGMLVRSHMPSHCDVALQAQADAVGLELDMAVTLGLIANELILNSLKHAFAGRAAGTLTVALRRGSHVEMFVRDDGNGLPAGFDPKKSSGLGLELVMGLTQQIRGEAKIENNPKGGTSTTIRFPFTDPQKDN